MSQRKSAEIRNHDLNEAEIRRRSEINKIQVDFALLQEKMKRDVEYVMLARIKSKSSFDPRAAFFSNFRV